MVPSVPSSTEVVSTTSTTETSTIPATSAGLASTASTLTSCEQNDVHPFVAWINHVARLIRTCLKWFDNWLIRIPYFGTFFMTPAQFDAYEDRKLVAQIHAKRMDTTDVLTVIDDFRQLRTPLAKMEIFHTVLNAIYVYPDRIARQFYANLPEDMQNEFKRQIWIANNEQDNGHGLNYGDYVVNLEIRGQIALQAAANQYLALQASQPDSILTIVPASTTAATTN